MRAPRSWARSPFFGSLASVLAGAAFSTAAQTASPSPPGSVTNRLLLLDNLGRVVAIPTPEVRPQLLPPPDIGLDHQSPSPVAGMRLSETVLDRLDQARAGSEEFEFFPSVSPRLMSYLASQDEFGNTAIRPGALIPFFPLEPAVQGGKYRLAEHGLRYSLVQTFTVVGMSEVMQGAQSLGYYTLDLKTKWALFDAHAHETAGWISAQIDAKTGLGSAGQTQDAKSNLGTLTNPTGLWSDLNGFRIPELAWQQSLRDGEIVVVAGMVSQRLYLDGNAAAHTGRGEFINSALINSLVLPLSAYTWGVNLQWQPLDEWYAMLGSSVGESTAGQAPWTDFRASHWSTVGEFGYAPTDFLGLGTGVYRVQPFVAQAGGPTQGGLGFNLQQHLGRGSPWVWFGRFGFGGAAVTDGAEVQAGSGFVLQAPLAHFGWVPRLSNDLLGVGFVWSQPSATTKRIYHENEYVAETFYTLQLTPTMKLQPDLQVVWNPAFNPQAGAALVGQLQLNLAW